MTIEKHSRRARCCPARIGVALTLALVMAGCTKPQPQAQPPSALEPVAPFTVAGVGLGMKDIEIRGKTRLDSVDCREVEGGAAAPEMNLPVSCALRDQAVGVFEDGPSFSFFGAELHQKTGQSLGLVEYRKTFDGATRIKMRFDGAPPSMDAIENAWNLKGRCLSEANMKAMMDKGVYVIKGIEMDIVPLSSGSFACMSRPGQFLRVVFYGGKSEKAQGKATESAANSTAMGHGYIVVSMAPEQSASIFNKMLALQ